MAETGVEMHFPDQGEIEDSKKKPTEPGILKKFTGSLIKKGNIPVAAVMLGSVYFSACRESGVNPSSPTLAATDTPRAQQTIEAMPSQTAEIATPAGETPSEIETLRQKIEADENQTEIQKQEALDALQKFETAYQNTDKLVKEYRLETTNGKPVLLLQEREKLGQMDLSPLWEGKFQSEDEFLEDRISFVHDNKVFENTVIALATQPSLNAQIIDNIIDQSVTNTPFSTYLEMNTLSTNEWIIDPSVPSLISEKLNSSGIKPIGSVLVRSDDGTGAHFEPYPTDADYPTITIGKNAPPETVIHEAGHVLDIVDNPNILKYVSPTEAVKLTIARNIALLKTAQFSNYNDVYSPESYSARIKEGTKSEAEMESLVSSLANKILTHPTKERGAMLTENVFAKYLNSEELEKLQTQDIKYLTVANFLNGEAANLENIASQNPLLGLVIEEIKANSPAFENYYGKSTEPPLPGFRGYNFYSTLKGEFAPTVLTTLLYKNDPRFNSLLTQEQRSEIINNQLKLNIALEREQLAELTFEATTTGVLSAGRQYLSVLKTASGD